MSRSAARGRPRVAARNTEILRAAADLLSEVGYDRLSIEATAVRAGVAKTTIYRRWPDKAALIAAVVEQRALTTLPDSEPADLRTALLEVMHHLGSQMAGQDLGLLTALLAARRSDPALAAALQPVLSRDAAVMTAPLERAGTRSGGALRPDYGSVVADLAPALVLHEVLLTGAAPSPARLDHLVERILLPLITEG